MPALSVPPTPPARQHPSALALHEFHLDVLPRREAERVARHISWCEPCRNDLSGLVADHRRFGREVFPLTAEAVMKRRAPWSRWRLRWPLALPSVAVAAVTACL